MRSAVVDANVFVSFFIERHEAQRAAARDLLQSAEDGEIATIVPQSVVFEVATSFPGVQLVDECPWKRVFEIWPALLTSLADAAIVAVATAGRHDAVATFDRKLSNRLQSSGLAAYW